MAWCTYVEWDRFSGDLFLISSVTREGMEGESMNEGPNQGIATEREQVPGVGKLIGAYVGLCREHLGGRREISWAGTLLCLQLNLSMAWEDMRIESFKANFVSEIGMDHLQKMNWKSL